MAKKQVMIVREKGKADKVIVKAGKETPPQAPAVKVELRKMKPPKLPQSGVRITQPMPRLR